MNLTLSEKTQDKLGIVFVLLFGVLMMGLCFVVIPLILSSTGVGIDV